MQCKILIYPPWSFDKVHLKLRNLKDLNEAGKIIRKILRIKRDYAEQ